MVARRKRVAAGSARLVLRLLHGEMMVAVGRHGVQVSVRMEVVGRRRRGRVQGRRDRRRDELLRLLERRLRSGGRLAGSAARGRRAGAVDVGGRLVAEARSAGRRGGRGRGPRRAGRRLLALVIHAVLQFRLYEIVVVEPAIGSHHLRLALAVRKQNTAR